eukprot:1218069-Amphidinium_carterae.1
MKIPMMTNQLAFFASDFFPVLGHAPLVFSAGSCRPISLLVQLFDSHPLPPCAPFGIAALLPPRSAFARFGR